MTAAAIRVLIVEDHDIVRKGLRALLSTEEGIEVVGEASNGRGAVELAQAVAPDVVLMDLVMPQMGGIEAIREIRSRRPDCNILVLTSYGTDNKLFPAIRAGAVGYLLKDTSPEELTAAIRSAARGMPRLDGGVARRLLQEVRGDDDVAPPREPLTEREMDVLREVARGASNETIAAHLAISKATVRTHVSNILGKLGLSNRTQAALYALRTGLASIDEIDPNPK